VKNNSQCQSTDETPYTTWAIDPKFYQLLENHYNLLDIMATTEFDKNPILLEQRIKLTAKSEFQPKDRYVIVFFDTDFFWHGHGITLNNILSVWRNLDLPFYTLIIYTNHIGLSTTIHDLTSDRHLLDRPTVVETFINPWNYDPDSCHEQDPKVDDINLHALCLMAGNGRSHRYAAYTNLKDLVPDQIAMTVKAPCQYRT
jgi:hypothetical protein